MTTKLNYTKESDTLDIYRKSMELLDEKKAENIMLMDLREVNSYLDYFLIATGNSRIHCRSLAKELEKFFLTQKIKIINRPDYSSGWIILDYGEIIIHIFTEDLREYYQLEKLWSDARVL